jgi:hypothetical protein
VRGAFDEEYPNAIQTWSSVPKAHGLTSGFSPAAMFRPEPMGKPSQLL